MCSLPKRLADWQQSYQSARLLIGDNEKLYKGVLKTCVSVSIDEFLCELDGYSSISHYLNVPRRDIFDYADWDDYLLDILRESELVHVRSFSDRCRLQALVFDIKERKRVGRSRKCFEKALKVRDGLIDDFLTSPYLLGTVMSKGALDAEGIKTAWVARNVANDVVFLRPIIEYCVEEIQVDEEIIPEVEKSFLFRGAMRQWKYLLKEDKLVELYEFVLSKVKKVASQR